MSCIMVVDDHSLIFDGLKNVFSRQRQSLHCYYGENEEQAQQIIEEYKPDRAILDITLGQSNGFDLAKKIKTQVEHIFFLTMHHSTSYLLRAYRDGYKGYFLKSDSMDLMVAALTFPELKYFWAEEKQMKKLESQQKKIDEPYENLSLREQEIFRLLAQGLGYKEIGYKLGISSKTASAHRYNILKKLLVKNQAELVHYAMELGIVEYPHQD
ncbi:MAG: response regulator transcription factor [Spirochaetaceae bacterium]|jgi:two-component system response regulator NreC|nr:response regulator transcription factor [Spirochaetaceae bacterium]